MHGLVRVKKRGETVEGEYSLLGGVTAYALWVVLPHQGQVR